MSAGGEIAVFSPGQPQQLWWLLVDGERFRRWAELILGLLDFLRVLLGCATLEAFLGLSNSMGLEEEPASHGQECMINALSLVTGKHLACANWPHPTSQAELSAWPVIWALLSLLQKEHMGVIRQWDRPFAVAPFPGEVRTIDSHCHVDTLVASGARVVDLFSGNGPAGLHHVQPQLSSTMGPALPTGR